MFNQQPTQQTPPTTTSQELQTTPTSSQTNQPQSSTRISFQENPYTVEERHTLLSEALTPVVRHAPLRDSQYEPTYKNCPSLQQKLNREDILVKTKIKHLQWLDK